MSRRFQGRVRWLHRCLAYLVGVQVLLWIIGGVAFAWLPFDSLIKGGAVLSQPVSQPLPSALTEQLHGLSRRFPAMTRLASHDSAQGPLLEFRDGDDRHWLVAEGELDSQPSAEQLRNFAGRFYSGDGMLVSVERIIAPESRFLGLVDELYDRTDVWRVEFDDSFGTRLYFDGATGRYLTVRNDYWVFYDAMWRLHIMDYRGARDFNNWLLSIFSISAFLFAMSGAVLLVLHARRRLRQRMES